MYPWPEEVGQDSSQGLLMTQVPRCGNIMGQLQDCLEVELGYDHLGSGAHGLFNRGSHLSSQNGAIGLLTGDPSSCR